MDPDTRKKLMDELFAERDALERRIAGLEARQKSLGPPDAQRAAQEIRDLRAQADQIGRRWSEMQDEDVHDDDRGGIER